MNHIMIDLETMGTNTDAPILAIGAVVFKPDTGKLGDTFYVGIDPESAFKDGVVSGATIKWWMKQDDAARAAVMAGTVAMDIALLQLATFVTAVQDACVWGNGATFDISLLDAAYARQDQKSPWNFRGVRDCRTIADVASGLFDIGKRVGVGHHALDDAVYQAEWVSRAWMALRNGR